MLYNDVAKLSSRATALYRQDEDLRSFMMSRIAVRTNEVPLRIPKGAEGAITVVRTGVAEDRLGVAASIMLDPNGIRPVVQAPGTGETREKREQRVQNWLRGQIGALDPNRQLEKLADDGSLTHSNGYFCVMPDPQAWCAMPQLDLSDLETIDLDAIDARAASTRAAQRQWEIRHPPFFLDFIPAEAVIVRENPRRKGEILEAWIYQSMPIDQVLERYRRPDGKPAATKLAATVDLEGMDARQQVTVLTRYDETHCQVALITLPLDDIGDQRIDITTSNADDEMLWEGPHHMGCVPLAPYRGRERQLADPRYRYEGFLDRVLSLQVSHDELATQATSGVRFSVWPSWLRTRDVQSEPPESNSEGDTPQGIELHPFEVYEGLERGEDIKPLQSLSPGEAQYLKVVIDMIRAEITEKTLPDAAAVQAPASSGFHAVVDQRRAEVRLEPWFQGKGTGWVGVSRLLLRAAAALQREHGFDPIPARVATAEGAEDVTLPLDLAEQEWAITVNIRPQNIGGDLAAVQTSQAREQAGYSDHYTEMERLGVENPLHTEKEQRRYLLRQALTQDPRILEAAWGKWFRQLVESSAMALPSGGNIPSGLVPHLQGDPSLASRVQMPGMGEGPPAMQPESPANGLAGMFESAFQQNGTGQPGGRQGQGFGMSQASPGGAGRQDLLNSLSGV